MSDFCSNEDWLAAYLEKRLPERERRLFEIHLSECPQCLARLIATKAELDDMADTIDSLRDLARRQQAEYAPSPGGYAALMPSRLRWLAGKAAVAAGLFCALGFFRLIVQPAWSPELKACRARVVSILAHTPAGTLLLTEHPASAQTPKAIFRGNGAVCRRDLEEAGRLVRKALARHPDVPETHILAGHFHTAAGDPERAVTRYRRALLLRPGDPGILNNLAVATYHTGDPGAAAEILERALAGSTPPPEAYFNLGALYIETGDFESGRRLLERYLAVNPTSPWSGRARALIGQQDSGR